MYFWTDCKILYHFSAIRGQPVDWCGQASGSFSTDLWHLRLLDVKEKVACERWGSRRSKVWWWWAGILIHPETLEELGNSRKSTWGWMCEMLYMFVPALWMFSCPAKSEVSDQFFRFMPSTSQYASVLLLGIAMCAFQIQLPAAIQHQHTKGGPQRVVEGSAESCSTSPTFMDATTSRRSDSEWGLPWMSARHWVHSSFGKHQGVTCCPLYVMCIWTWWG